jgi:hypothetical protein
MTEITRYLEEGNDEGDFHANKHHNNNIKDHNRRNHNHKQKNARKFPSVSGDSYLWV